MRNLEELEAELLDPGKLSSHALIKDALKDNHRKVNEKTRSGYERHMEHFAHFLESAEQTDLYEAQRKHVRRFLNHLELKGGGKPHPDRLDCSWCRDHGYPDGRNGCGWSASQRKNAMSAIKFLYHHFLVDDDLPNIDPSQTVAWPKQVVKPLWAPNKKELKKILETQTDPRTRLMIHWMAYAPSRRQTFIDARWRDIDLNAGTWVVCGKGDQVETFSLNPRLIREFRSYHQWIVRQAKKNPEIAFALESDETAFVLLTSNGKPGMT